MKIVLLALLLIAPMMTAAQPPAAVTPPRLPEPRLVDSPWGDFPLQRLQPGARLRLTSPEGQRSEAQVITVRDSAIDLRAQSGAPVTSMTLSDLRALRAFEVKALPLNNRRNEIGGLIAGAALGALIAAAVHKDPNGGTANSDKPSREERIATTAGAGAFFGWYIGWRVLGRARWRPVSLP